MCIWLAANIDSSKSVSGTVSKFLTWPTNKLISLNSLEPEQQRFLAKSFVTVLATTHALIVLWPILGSAFSADDTFDSMVPMQLQYSGQSNWSFINAYTSNWSRTEGRFFPVAVIIGFYSHYFFPGRTEYKVAQLVLAVIAISMIGLFIGYLLKNFYSGIVAVLVLTTCMQMRVQYDALFQFSLQQPSVMIMFLTSLLLFISGIRHSKYVRVVVSCFIYLLVLLTYETTVLLWPIFLLIILFEKPKKFLSSLVISAVFPTIVVLNLLRLRSNVQSSAAGYTSNFELARLGKTFVRQAVGSIPMTYSEISTPGFLQPFPQHMHPESVLWLLAIAMGAIVSIFGMKKITTNCHRQNLFLALMGLGLWSVPALVVAQTARWQDELTLGNAYITVFQGSFGFVLVVIALLCELKLLIFNRSKFLTVGLMSIFSVLVLVATSSVVTNNPRAVAQFNPGYLWPRETFESSIESGVFGEVPAESKVLALAPEWWFNAPFVLWWGGPKLDTIISPMNNAEWADCISAAGTCVDRLGISHVIATFGRIATEPRVVVVGALQKMAGENGEIKGLTVATPRIFIDYPTRSSSLIDSKSRCLGWGKDRVGYVSGRVDDVDITLVKYNESSCLLDFSDKVSFNPYQFTAS
jgi:hypothetical protein